MLLIVLLVVFVVVMLIWLLAKTGAIAANSDWLAFIAVLVLGVVVFLVGTGVVVVERAPVR
jgi:predicted membrane channel-forming protein YqfA (hemolysin III family)